MAPALSPEAVAAYRRDGFHFPYRIMPRERALAIGEDFLAFTRSAVASRYPDPQNQLYLLKVHLLFTWADRICNDPGLLDAVVEGRSEVQEHQGGAKNTEANYLVDIPIKNRDNDQDNQSSNA